MKDFQDCPLGATGTMRSRNGKVVPKAAGWRKATPRTIAADRHAEAGRAQATPRARSVVAVKRVGAHIGLKAGDLLLLDTLAAFTQPQDWEAGQRPVVWPSNAYLMAQTGYSLSTLKRHARRLAEAGVIAFRDSPNGKRWGRRDAEGRIIEAYGFDLSPLAARVAEFEALAEEIAAERSLCQRLRREITVTRRDIRARLDAAGQGRGAARLWSVFEALLQRLPGQGATSEVLDRLLGRFEALLKRVAARLSDPAERVNVPRQGKEMNPREVISDPHIPTTNKLHPVNCTSSENEECAAEPPGKPGRAANVGVDIALIMRACPEFACWVKDLGHFIRDWADFVRAAGRLRPMIGISDAAWHGATAKMGKPLAAAALALVFDKAHRGEIASPGGYLRGMADKAGAGELHLERSFYGRLKGQAV